LIEGIDWTSGQDTFAEGVPGLAKHAAINTLAAFAMDHSVGYSFGFIAGRCCGDNDLQH
jgi:hypothetical protein